MADASLVLLVLQSVNTLALLGIAFAAGKYAQLIATLRDEVAKLREIKHEWASAKTGLELRAHMIERQIESKVEPRLVELEHRLALVERAVDTRVEPPKL